jgi:hypothetical protein
MNLSLILRDFSDDLAQVEQGLERALDAPNRSCGRRPSIS